MSIAKYAIHGCSEKNIVDWYYGGMPGAASNKTWLCDVKNKWNTWRVQAVVEGRHGSHNEKYGRYLPPHVVAYHELMHVEETSIYAKKSVQQEDGVELLTATKTIILLDFIYKKIHGLEDSFEVDYGMHIQISGKEIPLGLFANFYREQEARYGKLYLAVLSPESISFLK